MVTFHKASEEFVYSKEYLKWNERSAQNWAYNFVGHKMKKEEV